MRKPSLVAATALAAVAILAGAPVAAAPDAGPPGRGVQSGEPIQPSQYLSGSSDVRQERSGRGPGERSDEASAASQARGSGRPGDRNKPVNNADRREQVRERVERVNPDPVTTGRVAPPARGIQDRSSDVQHVPGPREMRRGF